MAKITFEETPLTGLRVLRLDRFSDARGWLARLYCQNEMEAFGEPDKIAQVNLTETKNKGAIRGLHFQKPPKLENKIIFCIGGQVFDVVVDLRKDSSSFMGKFSIELSGQDSIGLFVPSGLAHGFQALTDDCRLLYFHTDYFDPSCDAGLNPFDPLLNIQWPLRCTTISEKDKSQSFIPKNFKGI